MNALVRILEAPAWPILLWCGLAASLAAALVLPPAPARGTARRPPRWPLTLAFGTALFAPLYGLAFDALGRADLLIGSLFGFAHGLFALALLVRTRSTAPRGAFLRTLTAWILFGAIVGFLYPVPTA